MTWISKKSADKYRILRRKWMRTKSKWMTIWWKYPPIASIGRTTITYSLIHIVRTKKQFVIFSNLIHAYILCVAKKILIVICNDVKDWIPLLCIFACCSLVPIRGIWHNQCNRYNNYSILSLYHLDQCRFGFFQINSIILFFFFGDHQTILPTH